MPTTYNTLAFYNGTPHCINLYHKDDQLVAMPSDGAVRVTEQPHTVEVVQGVAFANKPAYESEITGLPEKPRDYKSTDVLVVAWPAADALMRLPADEREALWPGRIVTPNMSTQACGAVRNAEGQIIGTRSFVLWTA